MPKGKRITTKYLRVTKAIAGGYYKKGHTLTVCRGCELERFIKSKYLLYRSSPRCVACGGILDRKHKI